MSRPLLISAGGTGGHMFPALALARELERRGHESVLITDARGARYVGDQPHRVIRAASPAARGTARLHALFLLALGFSRSLWHVLRLRPAAVASLGGYASVPAALAARILRVPVLAHEQNAVLGRANRLIARRAARLCLSFEDTRGADLVPGTRRLVTGNPVRPDFAHSRAAYAPPAAGEPLRLLVIGGSQGARVFGSVLPAAVSLLSEPARARLRIAQQCRKEDLEPARAAYRKLRVKAKLATFLEDVARRMAEAHLVISRAGASSIAEILALARPSLLVPYPFAADDHQLANARVLERAGCAWCVTQGELDADVLAARLTDVLDSPARLVEMSEAARALARPDAAAAIADALLGLAEARGVPSMAREGLA